MSSPPTEQAAAIRDRVAPILQAMARGRAAHGYLLLGQEGHGCGQAARAVVSAHLCSDAVGGACGVCRSCRAVDAGSHPDAVWIAPASRSRQVLIEQVRELETRISRRPVWGECRAGVIVEADRMTLQAANAFLKTLEEPPPGTLLVLTARGAEGLPDTVVSRCQRVYIGETIPREPPPWADDLESALVALEQETSPLGHAGRVYAPLATVLSLLGELAASAMETPEIPEDADDSLARRMKSECEARSQSRYVAQRRAVVETMAAWYRDALGLNLGACDALGIGPERAATLETATGRLTPEAAENRLAAVHELQRDLDRNVQETLAFENCFLRITSDRF